MRWRSSSASHSPSSTEERRHAFHFFHPQAVRAEGEITRLKKQRDALNDRLAKIKSATAETWDEVRSAVGKAAAELEETLSDILKP